MGYLIFFVSFVVVAWFAVARVIFDVLCEAAPAGEAAIARECPE